MQKRKKKKKKKLTSRRKICLDDPSFRKPRSTPKRQTVLTGDASKIPLLGRGLKLSNLKPGFRVTALHLFVKEKEKNHQWLLLRSFR
jgi:hypothetical protein